MCYFFKMLSVVAKLGDTYESKGWGKRKKEGG